MPTLPTHWPTRFASRRSKTRQARSLPADNAISIVNPPKIAGKLAYPISTYTWAIVPLQAKNAKPVKRFLLFAISKTGQALGLKLLYAPIPDSVRIAAAKSIAKVKQG